MAEGIEKIERVIRRFDAMPDHVRAAAVKAVNRGADRMVKQMQRIAPVDKENGGRLRNSIRSEVGRFGDVSRVVIADAKNDKGVGYAAKVELGHKTVNGEKVEANPFFYPVVRLNAKKIRTSIRGAISRALKRGPGA